MAPTVDSITIADPPDAWRHAGFSVDDDGTCRVGQVRLRLVGPEAGKRIVGWGLRDVPAGDIDGLATMDGEAPRAGAAAPVGHANGVTSIDHVVLATPDLVRTTAALEAAGMDARGTRDSDTYGAPMRQVFFRLGEVILEVIGPIEAAGDGPSGFFGLAYNVADLDATAAFFGEHLGRVKDAVQPGRRIATLRHKAIGVSVATAFMSPEPR